MTVEATLIYPLIFGGILFLICLGLYLYNAAVIRQVAYIAALRGSLLEDVNQKEVKGYVSEQIQILAKEKMFFVSSMEENVFVTDSNIKVKLKVILKLPLIEIPFLNFKWNALEAEGKAKKINAVEKIRNVRRLYGS